MTFSLPGMNLYAMASSIIGKSVYTYFAPDSRVLDARGIWVSTEAVGVVLNDSIQAIPRELYESLGLDLSRYYVMIYTDNPLVVVDQGTSGGQIEFESERYQLESETDWSPIDGWRGVLAIRLNVSSPP